MSYDIELRDIEQVDDVKNRDNNKTIEDALDKIQEILNDINKRLTGGGL